MNQLFLAIKGPKHLLTPMFAIGEISCNASSGDGQKPEDCQTGPHTDRYWISLGSLLAFMASAFWDGQ